MGILSALASGVAGPVVGGLVQRFLLEPAQLENQKQLAQYKSVNLPIETAQKQEQTFGLPWSPGANPGTLQINPTAFGQAALAGQGENLQKALQGYHYGLTAEPAAQQAQAQAGVQRAATNRSQTLLPYDVSHTQAQTGATQAQAKLYGTEADVKGALLPFQKELEKQQAAHLAAQTGGIPQTIAEAKAKTDLMTQQYNDLQEQAKLLPRGSMPILQHYMDSIAKNPANWQDPSGVMGQTVAFMNALKSYANKPQMTLTPGAAVTQAVNPGLLNKSPAAPGAAGFYKGQQVFMGPNGKVVDANGNPVMR
jgi:hypothetical protein